MPLGAEVTVLDAMIPDYGGNLFDVEPIKNDITINFSNIADDLDELPGARQGLHLHCAGQVCHIMSLNNPFEEKFTLKEVDYMDGDMIYLFSDGYQDQFGGDFDKKFLRPHFYNTLFEMSSLPVKSQRDFLEKKLQDWMRDRTQTDDITVVGIRL